MKTNRLCPWFGADEAVGEIVGQKLAGCKWVGVGFAGGLGVLKFIKCRGGVANDLHRHVINLARVVRDPKSKEQLAEKLDAALFHPEELEEAQRYCRNIEGEMDAAASLFEAERRIPFSVPMVTWAYHYFICVWMGRGGKAGTNGEFKGALPTRWNANGGGSNIRYRSIVASLEGFHNLFRAWEFECMDVFDFINAIADIEENGGYFDAPWPGAGGEYKHKFTELMHRRMAKRLVDFQHARIVIRFGDHPLIREIYTPDRWNIIEQGSRDQANQAVPELLILNRVGGGN